MRKSRYRNSAAIAMCLVLLSTASLLHGDDGEAANPAADPAPPASDNSSATPVTETTATPPAAEAAPSQPAGLEFTLDIRDGSHLVCRGAHDLTIPLATEFGNLTIPLRMIQSIDFNEEHKTAVAHLHNDDRLTGTLGDAPIQVQTAMGNIEVPTNVIVRFEVKRPEFVPNLASETPAKIETDDADAEPLTNSGGENGWTSVPLFLQNADIYSAAPRSSDGKLRFRVIEDGIVYLACHFGYEGNAGGDWKTEALTEADFMRKGWRPVAQMVAGSGRTYAVLRKPCAAGESFNLRCNKYSPPLVVLLHSAK